MAKIKSVFICNNCAYESPKWSGKCPECGRWNSFEETEIQRSHSVSSSPRKHNIPTLLSEGNDLDEARVLSGVEELDRVLGGGIFPGSVTLVAGDPGIGKSTLLLQMAGVLTKKKYIGYVCECGGIFTANQRKGSETANGKFTTPSLS